MEAAAALLDTAGRFLYRLPETHERMATMAEVGGMRLPIVDAICAHTCVS